METWRAVPGSADYPRHCRRLVWAVYEAACLLHGVEPPEDPREFANLYVNKRTRDKSAPMYNELSTAYEDVKGATLQKLIWWEEAPDNVDWGYGLRKVNPSELVAWARDKRGYMLPTTLADFFKKDKIESRTPESSAERRERLTQEIEVERKRGTKNFNKVVAERNNMSVSNLKRLTGKPSATTNSWSDLTRTTRQSSRKRY